MRLRPQWHDDEEARGAIKVVMTGAAADPPEWQPRIRDRRRREQLASRFRGANDPFGLVIVRDMWLTRFRSPESAHDVRGQADA